MKLKKTSIIVISVVTLIIILFSYLNKINLTQNSNRTSHETYVSYGFLDDKENNIESLIPLQTILPIRFKINDFNDEIEYEKLVETYTDDIFDNISISDKENNSDLLYKISENEDAFLTLGNDSDKTIDYAVVLFNNWKQVQFNDGDMTKFFEVKPQEKQSIKLKVPDVAKDTYFQAIAFPLPYKVGNNDIMSTNAFGSCKFIIKNTN